MRAKSSPKFKSIPSITIAYWPFTVDAEKELTVCKSALPSSTSLALVIRKNAREGLTIQNTSGDAELNVTTTRPLLEGELVLPVVVPFEYVPSCMASKL